MSLQKLQVKTAYDEKLMQEFSLHDAQAVEKALSTAVKLFETYPRTIKTAQMMLILEKAANLVEARSEAYALEAAREGGKPLQDSRVELARAVQGIREALRSIPELVGREIPMNLNAASAGRRAYTIREPRGVVIAISAFNHPFNLIVHQVIPALAVGCPVIVKPAPTTPLSCINLVNCLYEAGLPPDWCQIIHCDNELAEKMVSDPRVSFLTFIGSAKVGWYLRSKLAPGATCALEHGGAAPVIFDQTAKIKESIPLLLKGGFYHAGQVCVSVQRIFAHESVFSELCEGLVAGAKKLKVGDPTQESTEVGPLILPREVDRVDEWVQEAVQKGAKLLCGGKKIGKTCYEPTILQNPSVQARVSQLEIFGPLINVYSYNDRHEAIRRANALPYSFQASVFSQDIDVIWDSVQRLQARAVMVNDHTAFRVDWMPFGGSKHSGMGMGGILPSMLEMSEEKMLVMRSPVL